MVPETVGRPQSKLVFEESRNMTRRKGQQDGLFP